MLSAGIIPVYRPAGPQPGPDLYLLLRCYNYWDFPKGGVQTGETPIEAALRELQEETTLEKAEFAWGEDFRETPVYAQGKVARFYVARVDRLEVSLPVNPFLGRPEHHEFRWVDYETARSLLHPRVKPILDWARELSRSAASSPQRELSPEMAP